MRASVKRKDGVEDINSRRTSASLVDWSRKKAETLMGGAYCRILNAIDAGSAEGGGSGRFWTIVGLFHPKLSSQMSMSI